MIVFSCIGPIEDKDETSLKAKIKDLKKWRNIPSPVNRLKSC